MNPTRGYYSLIQYCPDLARLEAANIGVLLFRPEPHFIGTRTSSSNQRIRRFFGSQDDDWDQINALKSAIEERLESEGHQFRTLEDLERFIATRGNEIQLTPPRPVKVINPEQDLELLYQRLVGGPVWRKTATTVLQSLSEVLADETVARFLKKQVSVTVPAFHRPVTVPFAFKNGRFNLIQPATFESLTPSKAITRACRYAVEGRSLFEHPDERLGALQLLVVGEFAQAPQDTQTVVREIFEENDVRLFGLAELPRLVEEIRRTGKVLTA
jgi:Protein of unknown function (DUF3037)